MLRIYPFKAVRPRPDAAKDVASVPYDVVSREEARALGEHAPDSFIHVVRADADIPDDVSPYDRRVYELAKANFERLWRGGVLLQEDEPRLYLYRQQATIGGRELSQTGLVCCVHVEDYDKGRIKKHEKTRKEKEDDRTNHVLALNANAGPVFLAHRASGEIDALVRGACEGEPLYDFVAVDGVRHTVWVVDPAQEQAFLEAYGSLEAMYVADGHHRSASASRAAAERRKANPGHTGAEEYNRFMAAVFPADQLTILPYNRVVTDLHGMDDAEFLANLEEACAVTPTSDPVPGRAGVFCVFVGGEWHACAFQESSIDHADPIASLDVSLLSERVLEPILGIGDVRTDPRIDFVGGGRGAEALQKMVETGKAAAAFSMHPTTMEQLLAVSDAGMIMPPKSTWFEPKLRSGLLVHMLD
ncbi:MAG: DUF1015 domain-containing protein [Phycisphaerales bacterium]|nr:MAG: DUF1015 domain-containing protein [Phycisphaerales bacterium]